ncbi:MAG: TetR/AcrR family transcriptional regulator [Candidatus Eremiobacteraeota bacterium]|nr:TetR/AcrR family transcriptional regulator [Candidatus Eremiobacteraeota bacterium]
MSTRYEDSGRRNQKSRTRAALIASARALLQEGRMPTVEETAAAASVSRPTAYRYFPNQRLLLAAAHPEVDRSSLLSSHPSGEPLARLDRVAAEITKFVHANETALRAALRLSLESPNSRDTHGLRVGRRLHWVEDALAPLRPKLPNGEFRKLTLTISATLGIEAFVWLRDVVGLSRDAALKQMRWGAHQILRSFLAELD